MSEQTLLWAGGVLVATILSLIGVIYWQLRKDINEIRVLAAQTSFASFLERDREREAQWYLWRNALEEGIARARENDAKWRHDVYAPTMSSLQLEVGRMSEMLRQIEKWKNGKQTTT